LCPQGPASDEPGNKANFLTVDLNSDVLSWTIHVSITQFSRAGTYMSGADIFPPDDSNDGVPKRYAAHTQIITVGGHTGCAVTVQVSKLRLTAP
jgi:hypothetical protein